MFWTTYKRERAAELESLPTEELLEMASTIDKRERATELSSHPFPLKWMIQAIDPLHPQRSTMKIQISTRPRRFHPQATIQIPTPRLPTRPSGTIQTSDSLHPQRSTVNWHNLRSLSIASGVRLLEPAPLDWPKSQPNLLSLDIAHRAAMTYP